ncbi:Glycogen phosphorylase/Starch phosphorylase [Methylacidimicrobium sp. AP8]|uniref:alpha-glucan family phosphorylase n=1 Tax=Methylacidimicrobium sp. AP8 TaxID=2730359 RepID=UPI0018C0E19B|nr:alpha-glucan family phosphorylase [Methylacidimicrobium sp. AP8]CAB4242827.1 Glycogen phosphorylase/Starch phosphorylase [Methylacidimicrobium sp. AP8]
MPCIHHYLARELPSELAGLEELAADLLWLSQTGSHKIWQMMDAKLWEETTNPWFLLESVSESRLEQLRGSPVFLEELQSQLAKRKAYLEHPTWFETTESLHGLGRIAYFSMEFGLSEALPIYSGGLGILAGDCLKAASDLGVPMVGVGLLYQQGYFRQVIAEDGRQVEYFPYNDPTLLPVIPVRTASGEWLRVKVALPGRDLILRVWEATVGRVPLYLLDSNDPVNSAPDRTITGALYGGGTELRLLQEMALGIGGWRALQELGDRYTVCHLNEGHAAFAVLERARAFGEQTGQPFAVSLRATRAGNLFTTHTPVPAGFDSFPAGLVRHYLSGFAAECGIPVEEILRLGRLGDGADEPLNMAYLAIRGSAAVNGVSRLHGAVSRKLFQPLFPRWPQNEVPVGHVTNGIHVPTWHSPESDEFWTRFCGPNRWRQPTEVLEERYRQASERELWEFRMRSRMKLILAIRRRRRCHCTFLGKEDRQMESCACIFDPNTLTLGFARRFATYKRPDLLLHDPGRLLRILTNPSAPMQLVIAGKAHPADQFGKEMIRRWNTFAGRPETQGRIVFLEDYDMRMAKELVSGVDLWINNPRRPWEASGTSGMKLLANGGLNLSELDGWWVEAYRPEVGWALGDGREHGEDPAWDAAEADQLYRILEQEVAPAFYERDPHGVPTRWIAKIRESTALLTGYFSTNRMVRQYTIDYYRPLDAAYLKRSAKNGARALEIEERLHELALHWKKIRFGPLSVTTDESGHRFSLPVYLDEISPEWVRVEVYADPPDGEDQKPVVVPMERVESLAGAINAFLFQAAVPADRPAQHYTPRVRPFHPDLLTPLEANQILWYA